MTDPHDIDQAWLSPLLNHIADVAGVRAALILGNERGCQTIYIPRRFGPKHWLPKLVGMDAALKLASSDLGGTKIVLPPALIGQKRRRQRAIADMTRKGYSINATAASLGVARSTVNEHRRKLKGGDDGGDQGQLI